MKNTFTKCYFSTSKKEYNFEETRDKNRGKKHFFNPNAIVANDVMR
jgi:hypothetical protein